MLNIVHDLHLLGKDLHSTSMNTTELSTLGTEYEGMLQRREKS